MKPTVLTFSQNSNGLFSQRFKSGENSLVGFCKILLSLTKNILHNIYVIYITNISTEKLYLKAYVYLGRIQKWLCLQK